MQVKKFRLELSKVPQGKFIYGTIVITTDTENPTPEQIEDLEDAMLQILNRDVM